jgi:hypothetical protein
MNDSKLQKLNLIAHAITTCVSKLCDVALLMYAFYLIAQLINRLF